uniref:DUF834 domain-containing protein n=1 Tax=Oryza glumipatula TaxID=40148 RepID=A0A0E0A630_9ORYZ
MARYAARWIYMALIDAVGRLMALGSDDSPSRWTDRHRIRRARQIQKDGDACVGNVGGGRDASAASGAIGMGGGGCEDVVGGGWRERREERWTSTAFQGGSDEVRVAMTAEGSDARPDADVVADCVHVRTPLAMASSIWRIKGHGRMRD